MELTWPDILTFPAFFAVVAQLTVRHDVDLTTQ